MTMSLRWVGGAHSREIWSHASGGWKSKIGVLAGWVLLGRQDLFGPLALACGWLSSAVPSPCCLPSVCVSVSKLLLFIRRLVVLVSSGRYSKCHRLYGLNNRNRPKQQKQTENFLTGAEAGKFKMKVQPGSVSGESSLAGLWTVSFLLCPHRAEGNALASLPLHFYGHQAYQVRAPPSWSHLTFIVS